MRIDETTVGGLRALVHVPDLPLPLPGLVLVDGSGDGTCDGWLGWAERLAALGAVVLTHDKPGCGGSPGSWIEQSLDDRADESLAALAVLRRHPSVTGRAGFLGVSQGGWVSLLAASRRTDPVDFVVSLAGPGVGPAAQDRYRIAVALAEAGIDSAEALAWLDERNRRLATGEPVERVLADQELRRDRPWYAITTRWFDEPSALAYVARLLPFEPADVLPKVPCPVLALHGGADPLVPAAASVTAYAAGLRGDGHGIAVFPGADHGLFVAAPDPAVDRTEQVAPGALAMIRGLLATV